MGDEDFSGLDWKKFNLPSYDLARASRCRRRYKAQKSSSIIFLDVTGNGRIALAAEMYPFINKYRTFTEGSSQNYIFYRLADVLLLKAEALNELGDLAGAAELVNRIRTRVSLPNTTAATQADMRLAEERRLDLAFEGHR
jgi:hypothetical protein